MRHGQPVGSAQDFLAVPQDDPALALVYADLDAWRALRPCRCDEDGEGDGLCHCEETR